jgi:TolA-binding protein
MVKHIAGLLLVFILSLGQCGCGEKTKSPAELKAEKEKLWRERQRVQAIKYYNELIKNYPDSPHIDEAKKKLDALGPAPTPAKK